jgi:glyoxylase-like metal-dependent hydrolase (beta-lactamase superfamily II)
MICTDERQFVPREGQRWLAYAALRGTHGLLSTPCEAGVTRLAVSPGFGIGQQAHLISTPAGNLLWDCLPVVDDTAMELVAAMGGLSAIAISHPHFYTGMTEWSRAFDAPIYLHAADRDWVTRAEPRIVFWDEPRRDVLPGAELVHCGGHFPGSSVLHCPGANGGAGALFTGDTVQIGPATDRVGFMYSYPNHIPLSGPAVRRIADRIADLSFTRLYGAFGQPIAGDAAMVRDSATRYLRALESA